MTWREDIKDKIRPIYGPTFIYLDGKVNQIYSKLTERRKSLADYYYYREFKSNGKFKRLYLNTKFPHMRHRWINYETAIEEYPEDFM